MKKYHHTVEDLKELLGKLNHVATTDRRYFDNIYTNLSKNDCSCKDEFQSDLIMNSNENFFTRICPCPNIINCQTFLQWKHHVAMNKFNRFLMGYKLKQTRLKFCVLPIGPFPDFVINYKTERTGQTLFELLTQYIGLFFTGSEVSLLPFIDIHNLKVTKRENSYTKKTQYLVTDFFPLLRSLLPKDSYCIIGITWEDVYPCKDLNFVLGQANFFGYSCIATFGRFDPTFVKGFKGQEEGIPLNELKDLTEINGALLWKLLKVVTHETCHLFGLAHCSMFDCLMNESSSTAEALSQPMLLCPLCMNKIYYAFSNWCKTTNLFKTQVHLAGIYQFFKYILLPICSKESDSTTKDKVMKTLTLIEKFFKLLCND